ncbi:hypothetical protein JAAARDRAFT_206538 [Jaapia argillacea MUCL 33604]|uniref:Uncharacterized protein n=1 Tax=Jaapia argillacea MUCL 33604 TaxID=933084 RepID=A0A067Q5A7_9AGAM|nr:hypothetical protein JAAARDRAFT_206538 [Jaapia argillacea MUCL 33604]
MTLVADMHYSMHGDPQMSYHNERHSPASSFHSTTERDTLPHASTSSHAHWQSIAHSYLSVPTDAVYTAGSGCSATDSGTSYSWSNFHSPSLTDSCEISQESVHPAHPHSYSALRMHSDYGESSISLPALPPSLSPMPSKSTSPPPNRLPTSHHKSKRRTSQSSSSSSSPTQAHRPSPYSRTAQSPRSKPTIKQEPDEFIMELPSPSPTRHIIPTSPYALANTASTVPLRATQASKEMRAMMGVFRLDPFACMGDGNDGWRYEDEMGPLQEEAALLEWQLEGPGWDVEEGPSLIPFEEEEDLDLLVDGESASGSEIASSGVSSFVRRGSWDVAQDDLDELVYPSPEMITDHFSPTGSMYRGLSRAGLRSDIHQTAITPAFAVFSFITIDDWFRLCIIFSLFVPVTLVLLPAERLLRLCV